MRWIVAILVVGLLMSWQAEPWASVTNTSRGKLHIEETVREVPVIDDSTVAALPDTICRFNTRAVTLSAFKKRAGDVRETFVVKNCSRYHITQIKLLMRYIGVDGNVIVERAVVVPCDVMPQQSRRVAVRSFDQERRYYYRYGGKPRLKAVPFDVAVRLLRYDVAVENGN